MATKVSAPVKPALDALAEVYGAPEDLCEERPLEQIILLFLSRGADYKKSQQAFRKLQAGYVDWNEVRVTTAYELRKITGPLGPVKTGDKADQLKDLLGNIFNRFNKLHLDFLSGATDADSTRKRDRFVAWLSEKHPAIAAIMQLHGAAKMDVVVTSGFPRILQRLGWLDSKTSGATAVRQTFAKLVPDAQRIPAQWGLYHALEECCIGRGPNCPACPLLKFCPTGKEEAKIRTKVEAENARKAAIAAKKLAQAEKKAKAKK